MQLVLTLQTTSMSLTHNQQGQPQQWGYGTLSLSPPPPRSCASTLTQLTLLWNQTKECHECGLGC